MRSKKTKTGVRNHDVVTVPEVGWAGKSNGELLRLAEGQFDVFVTADQKLTHQQEIKKNRIAVIVLAARNNRLETLKPLMPRVQKALQSIQPNEVVRIAP